MQQQTDDSNNIPRARLLTQDELNTIQHPLRSNLSPRQSKLKQAMIARGEEYWPINEEGRERRCWYPFQRAFDHCLGRWGFLDRSLGGFPRPQDLSKWGDAGYGVGGNGNVRCSAIRKCGKRCALWSLKGSLFCRLHFGARNRDLMPGVRRMLLERAISDASPELANAIRRAGVSAKELDDASEESIIGRAIVGEALRDLLSTDASGKEKYSPIVRAELAMTLIRQSQALVLGTSDARVRFEKFVPITEFYGILNSLVMIMAGEFRRLANTEQDADRSMRRTIAAFLSLEIAGEPLFDVDRLTGGEISVDGEQQLINAAKQLIEGVPLKEALISAGIAPGEEEDNGEDRDDAVVNDILNLSPSGRALIVGGKVASHIQPGSEQHEEPNPSKEQKDEDGN